MKARLYTKLLKKKVRVRQQGPDDGRAGIIVNVYLEDSRPPRPLYTVMLKDGRLLEFDGLEFVVE
jgi:hypothetical protein